MSSFARISYRFPTGGCFWSGFCFSKTALEVKEVHMIGMGSVPMFKLRPYRSMLIAAALVGVVGGLLSIYFFKEDAYNTEMNRGLFTLIFTGVVVVILIVGAYSRFGFKHLRHHRPGYKHG